MYGYSPFTQDIADIQGKELETLRDISEGWYVDYKKEGLEIRDIAKHICSFSNQFGGWLFFGIDENSETRAAGNFCGIPNEDVSALREKISKAATIHINPEVFFEEKVITGPVPEINLAFGRSIIIIGIPQGQNSPYIHSSGKIYRRSADSSKPIEEKDRHALDLLFQRSLEGKKRFSEFINSQPKLPPFQKNSSYAYIFFLSDPLFTKQIKHDFSFDDYKGIFNLPDMNLNMDNFFRAKGGFIARSIYNNQAESHVASARYWLNGNARYFIPINKYNPKYFRNQINSYDHINEFFEEYDRKGFEKSYICDLNYLAKAILVASNQFLQFRENVREKRKAYFCITIKNICNTVPFVDEKYYIDNIKQNGIPFIDDNIISVPEYNDLSSLPRLKTEVDLSKFSTEEGQNENFKIYLACLPLISLVFTCFGVVREPEDFLDFYKTIYGKKP